MRATSTREGPEMRIRRQSTNYTLRPIKQMCKIPNKGYLRGMDAKDQPEKSTMDAAKIMFRNKFGDGIFIEFFSLYFIPYKKAIGSLYKIVFAEFEISLFI